MNILEAYAYLKQLGNEVLNMSLSLEAPARVLRELGNPHQSLRVVLVGGTNGKGSVSYFTAAILSCAGYRTALYTSPHLESVLERFRVNGQNIAPDDFARCVSRVIQAQDRLQSLGELARKLTYFETLSLVAFTYFNDRNVDLVVLEVGLGGRLDVTNLSDPLVSCIASVGPDHCNVLGQTIAEIAREKAAIGRPGRTLCVGAVSGEAEQAIRQTVPASLIRMLNQEEYNATSDGTGRYCVQTHTNGQPLKFYLKAFGAHQVNNAVLAVRVVEALQSFGFKVPHGALRFGLQETEIPGRLEKVLQQPVFFIDGAHNPPAIEAVTRFIQEQFPEKVDLIFGMMRDKEIQACAQLLAPACKTIFLTPVQNRRSATVGELRQFFPDGTCVLARNSKEATCLGLSAAGQNGILIACGSLFLVGEIKALLKG
ncbi:MAG: bifunctional folylpolyglutamate synthase/dihydrofolate synthase [Acidobacteria bacterium]|nr:bifunctional folylpolyglutamate synthase/dihydrofolate synthase [Acidobacteriota bacterium]